MCYSTQKPIQKKLRLDTSCGGSVAFSLSKEFFVITIMFSLPNNLSEDWVDQIHGKFAQGCIILRGIKGSLNFRISYIENSDLKSKLLDNIL